jgi:hypothetical protein
LHVLVITNELNNVLVEHCRSSVLSEDISVIVITRDMSDEEQTIVLQLSQEVLSHINMPCAASNTPAVS